MNANPATYGCIAGRRGRPCSRGSWCRGLLPVEFALALVTCACLPITQCISIARSDLSSVSNASHLKLNSNGHIHHVLQCGCLVPTLVLPTCAQHEPGRHHRWRCKTGSWAAACPSAAACRGRRDCAQLLPQAAGADRLGCGCHEGTSLSTIQLPGMQTRCSTSADRCPEAFNFYLTQWFCLLET